MALFGSSRVDRLENAVIVIDVEEGTMSGAGISKVLELLSLGEMGRYEFTSHCRWCLAGKSDFIPTQVGLKRRINHPYRLISQQVVALAGARAYDEHSRKRVSAY